MKLYLAAPFRKRLEIRAIADTLWNKGFDIVSSWIHEAKRPEWMSHEQFFGKLALKDLTEISAADCVILDTREQSETGGKEAEWGYALHEWHRKLLIIVGEARNPFHELADQHFATWDSCIGFLEKTYGKRIENREALQGDNQDTALDLAMFPTPLQCGD